MKQQVRAIEPHDGKQPGDSYTVSARHAQELEAAGLVKIMREPANKMAPAPANKAAPSGNESRAAGTGAKSPASRAARASTKGTAGASKAGETKPHSGDASP